MRITRARLVVIALLLAFGAAVTSAAPPETDTEVPDFTLMDLEGRPMTLSERTGKGPVILVFFRGAW